MKDEATSWLSQAFPRSPPNNYRPLGLGGGSEAPQAALAKTRQPCRIMTRREQVFIDRTFCVEAVAEGRGRAQGPPLQQRPRGHASAREPIIEPRLPGRLPAGAGPCSPGRIVVHAT